MSESPYINWYTSDFLGGISGSDMTAEQIGVYAVILALIADSDGPIEDDPAWLARRCNISTRKMSIILDQLAAMRNKIERRNGLIGNRRMLAEVARRDKKGRQARDAANERWNRYRAENKPQLPFEIEGKNKPIKSKKSQNSAKQDDADAFSGQNDANSQRLGNYRADNPEINREISSGINQQNSQNSADPVMRTHSDSRAGVNPELESIQTKPDSEFNESARAKNSDGLDRDGDLLILLERVSAAAGYVATTTAHYADAIAYIAAWRDLGASFEEVVIPTIEAAILKNPDRTSTLKRFDQAVRLAHASYSAKSKRGAPVPPPEPVFAFTDEISEVFEPFRRDLCAALGTRTYAVFAHNVRFDIPNTVNGNRVLGIKHKISTMRLMDDGRSGIVRQIAAKHGFTDVW